jgi:hypothetical protein
MYGFEIADQNKGGKQNNIHQKLLKSWVFENSENPIIISNQGNQAEGNYRVTEKVNDDLNCIQNHSG